MSLLLTGGRIQQCGAVPGREPVPVPEAVDVSDIGEQPGRAGRSDSVQICQGGTAVGDELAQFFACGFDSAVDGFQLADQFHDQAAPDLACGVAGFDGRDQLSGLGGRQKLLCSTRQKFQQQPVQAVDGVGAGRGRARRGDRRASPTRSAPNPADRT